MFNGLCEFYIILVFVIKVNVYGYGLCLCVEMFVVVGVFIFCVNEFEEVFIIYDFQIWILVVGFIFEY